MAKGVAEALEQRLAGRRRARARLGLRLANAALLAAQDISIGERCVVTGRQPVEGPITVRFGDTEHVRGRALARALRIELDGPERRAGRVRSVEMRFRIMSCVIAR